MIIMTSYIARRAQRLHAECERREATRFKAYTPREWDNISQYERDEYISLTKTILAGQPKHHGERIPVWMKENVREPLPARKWEDQ